MSLPCLAEPILTDLFLSEAWTFGCKESRPQLVVALNYCWERYALVGVGWTGWDARLKGSWNDGRSLETARARQEGRKPDVDAKKAAPDSRPMRDRETLIGEMREAAGMPRSTFCRCLTPDRTLRRNGGRG